MPGRTWIIAPDAKSLERRWDTLVTALPDEKETLFHPHLRKGKVGDKHSQKIVPRPLSGFDAKSKCVADETGPCTPPIRYGFRSFDRQWIIPDSRLINQPNPELWRIRNDKQVYLTAFTEKSPTRGPALTFTGLIPDLDHYKGSFGGRTYPLWLDPGAPNMPPTLLSFLSDRLSIDVTAEDLVAYIAAIAAHPAYTARFQSDLSTPGLRIPLTADRALFTEASELGRTVIWLYTFGERLTDPAKGGPLHPPRLPPSRRPSIPAAGAIPQTPMPDSMKYEEGARRLCIGAGYVENVDAAVWRYEVDGRQVLLKWFSYRKANRERPIIGKRRKPSPLGNVQSTQWQPEYTSELLNVLNVLGLLVDIEPKEADLLDRVCSGPLISSADLATSPPN